MRFMKEALALLAIQILIIAGCGGGGGNTAPPPSETVEPVVAITAPLNNADVRGVTTVSADASDNVAVTRVEFYLDGTLKSTVVSAPYTFSWDPGSLVRGNHTLTAKAYDAAGNVGQSAPVAVSLPITVSMSTVISGSTAVATVKLNGLSANETFVFGLDLKATLPAGASIDSWTPVGTLLAVPTSDPTIMGLGSGEGFGSVDVVRLNFSNIPAGAVASDFGVSLLAVYGSGGVRIQ